MEKLANIESFVRTAEAGSFTAAARRLGLTPAAVSRNVKRLEDNLGLLLFQRSTRSLVLTEAGAQFLGDVSAGLSSIQGAVDRLASADDVPAGLLKVSLPIGMGMGQVLSLLPAFTQRYPAVQLELNFENRQVDLIAEGFDIAVGGAIELPQGVVARELCRIHVVALASPSFLRAHGTPTTLAELEHMTGVVMRSVQSGKVRIFTLRNADGEQCNVNLKPSVIVNDPEALCRCAVLGMGVTLAPLTQAAAYIERGELVRLLPAWHGEVGAVSLYFSGQRLLPAKTRAFVDFLVEQFRSRQLARRFAALPPSPKSQTGRRPSR
ncbi:LysR family transcriptional regulator [Pseudoduganella sp. FT55W]|uniref:LysR family transcriptional regulator n=1 Tax=Duganella rivi TaxID=2666083 RepID=A0A7X4GKZ5_9BURK|nr:LysR family transcriptional regulator [Duganella rivi]MYM65398.1 LysR family transcriptional regulator [Duganella rivi]